MKEMVGNLWLESAAFKCIPTTGTVLPDGSAVLDSRPAKEAAAKFQGLEVDLGRLIASRVTDCWPPSGSLGTGT